MTTGSENHKGGSEPDPRVGLAIERTLLAWLRTGLAMMGFGFVVARFSLFLREMDVVHPMSPARQQGFSLLFGISLIVLGVVVNLGAAFQHWRAVRRLNSGQPLRFNAASFGVVIALLLMLLGSMMAVYLFIGPSVTALGGTPRQP